MGETSNQVGSTMKNQGVVGNGLLVRMTFLRATGNQVGMTFLQVTFLQVGMTFLLETSNQVGSTMKNPAAVGNGLQVGMIFLLETFHPAGIWGVGNLALDYQLADKKKSDPWKLDLGY